MAKVEALSPTMTHRIWQAHELQPHQLETFKLSADADLNDAARLSTDPTFRLIGSPTRWDRSAALTSTLHLFETELLSRACPGATIKFRTLGVEDTLPAHEYLVRDLRVSAWVEQ